MVLIKINIAPLGNIDQLLLDEIKKELRKRFKWSVDIIRPLEIPQNIFNKFRNQYESSLILEFLAKQFPDDHVLAVTDADVYTTGLNFIFGQAKLGRAALISTHRLAPTFYKDRINDKLHQERIVKESVHEIGHMLGLQHCREGGCIMSPSGTIRDIDNKSTEFCHMCELQLK